LTFADEVIFRARERQHPLCVGLDPYLNRIPSMFRRGTMRPEDPETAGAIEEFCYAVIDVIAEDVAVIKPQASLFECLGSVGWAVLERVIRHARSAGLLVLLDAKRGDIADTAAGYAKAYLSSDSSLIVDAMTVNAYLGPATVKPFITEAKKSGRGVVVLVRNSNPDSSLFQSLHTDAGPFFTVVARSLVKYQDEMKGPQTGWSSLGVTVAATHSEDSEIIREILPHALFLVLGFGAQGASAREAVRGVRRGPSGLEGGLVSSSRSILFPEGVVNPQNWEGEIRTRLKRTVDELGTAIAY